MGLLDPELQTFLVVGLLFPPFPCMMKEEEEEEEEDAQYKIDGA